jgi:hypothetical protein
MTEAPGSICERRKTRRKALFPGNWNLEKENAAKLPTSSVRIVAEKATIKLFNVYVEKGR